MSKLRSARLSKEPLFKRPQEKHLYAPHKSFFTFILTENIDLSVSTEAATGCMQKKRKR